MSHLVNLRCYRNDSNAARSSEVGGQLGISEITVKEHRGQVMRKMKAGSLADLVMMAARLGLRRTLND